MPDEASGEELQARAGPYRLLSLLGRGASADVYVARHEATGHQAAVKVLRDEHHASITKVMRFLLEFELVRRVKHPNVVELIDLAEDSSNRRYAVMEFFDGQTLRRILSHGGALAPQRAVTLALQLADALRAVHQAGIIHCDVKPDNVFVVRHGEEEQVKLFDFDAARWVDPSTARTTAILPHGAILGTPEYMPPEQQAGGALDYRADIYSFGVVLYEMLTGAVPSESRSWADTLRLRLLNVPRSPRNLATASRPIPKRLESLILTCLEHKAERRPQHMADVVLALQLILAELTGDAAWAAA